MFSSHQEPSQSNEKITFPMITEKETFDRSFYHPSLTANRLSTEEIDDTLSQIERIYRKKEDNIVKTVVFGALGCIISQIQAYRWNDDTPYHSRKPLHRGINAVVFVATGLFVWNNNKEGKEKAAELLERVNERTVPKGFRWYFPQSFSTIELYPDYTYDPNQPSLEENERSQAISNPERRDEALDS